MSRRHYTELLSIKDEKELAENLGIGEMTLHDIIEELEKLPYIHFKNHDYKDKVFHVTISSKKIQKIFLKTPPVLPLVFC